MNQKSTLLFERLAKKIENLIRGGVLKVGQKIPSIRAIKLQEAVSTSTVLRAYAYLEDAGLIESRPKSGFIVRENSTVPPKQLLLEPSVGEIRTGSLISSIFSPPRDPRVVNLGAAFPDATLMPNKALLRLVSATGRAAGPLANRYEFPPGHTPLRRELARRTGILEERRIDPDEVIITSGAIEGINLALRAVLKPGERLAVESPTYYGLLKVAESLGVHTVEIPTDPERGIDLQSLEKAIRSHKVRCLFLMPNFQNPLGSLMSNEKKERIASLASKYSVVVIEDDVQGDLHFGARRPIPLKRWDKDGWVIYLSSFSKTIAPGYRLGWIRPGRFYDKVLELKFTFTAGTPTLLQMAVAEYLKAGGLERHLKKLRRSFQLQVAQMSQAIQSHFPNGTRLTKPMGGFVLWVELPRGVDSVALSRESLKKGIAICPGPIFSPKGRYRNYVRLSCGQPWSERLERAVCTLARLIR